MTRASSERAVWEAGVLKGWLADIERAAQTVLKDVGWPVDLDDPFYATTRPRRTRTPRTARKNERGLHALMVLTSVHQLRSDIEKGDATAAAYSALQVGLQAYDGTTNWALARHDTTKNQKGGRVRAAEISREAAKQDSQIKKHLRRWEMSDELQDEYRSAATYIHNKEPRHDLRTIQRALKRIRSADSRQ